MNFHILRPHSSVTDGPVHYDTGKILIHNGVLNIFGPRQMANISQVTFAIPFSCMKMFANFPYYFTEVCLQKTNLQQAITEINDGRNYWCI